MNKDNNGLNNNFVSFIVIIIGLNLLSLLSNTDVLYSLIILFLLFTSSICVFNVYLFKMKYEKERNEANKAIIKRDNKIKELSYIDQITGLSNKVKVMEEGYQLINDNPNEPLSVICIDIKDFQSFNNINGVAEGDNLLKIIAATLNLCSRKYNNFSVGKVGSDEFTIILNADKEEAIRFIKNFRSILSRNLIDNNIESEVEFTVGVAIYPNNGESIRILYEKAAATLKISRENNSTDITFYDEGIIKIILEKRILEKKLRNCIVNSNFILLYQPKINLKTGKLMGREALIRWKDGMRGIIPPNDFIPLAESTGLIKLIDDWVIKEACHQNALWQVNDIGKLVQVSINISAQEFYNTNIVEKIKSAIKLTGLNPKYLDIELTETMTMLDLKEAIKTMTALKELGVTISLDDFGTGYSSLAYLRDLPIDVVKLDKFFIDDLETNNKSRSIVKYIIGLAKSLELKVVAEGVETESQHNILKSLGCDYGQGYYYGKPISPDQVEFYCKQRDYQRREIQ